MDIGTNCLVRSFKRWDVWPSVVAGKTFSFYELRLKQKPLSYNPVDTVEKQHPSTFVVAVQVATTKPRNLTKTLIGKLMMGCFRIKTNVKSHNVPVRLCSENKIYIAKMQVEKLSFFSRLHKDLDDLNCKLTIYHCCSSFDCKQLLTDYNSNQPNPCVIWSDDT